MNKLIYIVEDDKSIRELISMALTSFTYEIKTFDNAEDAMIETNMTLPDLIIFDIMLPKMTGIEATKQLRINKKTKKLPIILLTAKNTELDKVQGLDCGADDYITKPFSVMELGARLRTIFRRIENDNPVFKKKKNVFTISDLSINHDTREVSLNGKILNLTFKEYELLWMLIENHNRVVTREELFNAVWGYDFSGESRTLDIHIRTLRNKLGDDAEIPKYIKTIRNIGYRFMI